LKPKSQALAFFFGGLLPVIAFTVIEDQYGTIAGIIAGMVFGLGEVAYEFFRLKKVSTITWIGNLLILVLGGISLISSEGLWFKLQPALFEAFFALFLWGSVLFKKNILLMMAEKQGQKIPEVLHSRLNGITVRLGFFFAIHTGLAVWSALFWTTAQWALLKGVGLTVSFVLYMVLEMIFLRLSLRRR
jgi:intracellular septation protein